MPEVIYTTEGNLYLHLPGVIMAESGTGEIRYLLSDGLGSVRQATDESGEVVAYNEFDPYGNPVQDDANPYGFTGEWWESDVSLLHLRARWYAPETGTFLSVDPVESEPPYQYVRGNVVNLVDPTGFNNEESDETRYVYSCKCGSIDWDHAGPGLRGSLLWSPDEKYLVYSEFEMLEVNAGEFVKLPLIKHKFGQADGFIGASWSPDGQHLAVTIVTRGDPAHLEKQIYIFDIQDNSVRPLVR